ncbi:MAG: caspase family protein [Deltaproteobacteria bacterium]|nr:caspase family protein [Deltaproteobacteria bacterium]
MPLWRFALITGSNDGGPGRVPLRYAVRDAQGLSRVLEQLGGIPIERQLVLTDTSRAGFLDGLERVRDRLERARGQAERLELLLYYSGHSDENGLLLGRDRLEYAELRAALDRMPADVRMAVLDSCASGALIRSKGGKHVAPFLLDGSTVVRGHAFLTATAADEAAQESDAVRGSYFTSALLTGLRGAADASHDGKVTLHEAYQFAFNETLARTERSRGGAQHPGYDIELVGSGDLVLTDLRGSSAGLLLPPAIEGRLWLRDGAGNLVAELRKAGDSALELGLDPGRYEVTLDAAGGVYSAQIDLVEDRRVELKREGLQRVKRETVVLRGDTLPYRVVAANLSLVPPLDVNWSGDPAVNYFALNLLAGRGACLKGLELGFFLNWRTDAMWGAQLGVVNWDGGLMAGLQLGVGFNLAGWAEGLQLGGVGNVSAELRGLQLAGGFNWADGWARGVQLSGLLNVAAQGIEGAQLGMGLNVAPDASFQFAAANVAREVGTQVGGINLARRVGGLQLGLLNVAEHSEWPVGAINLIGDGYLHAELWGSDVTVGNLGVKMGGRRLYTLLAVGMQPRTDGPRWSQTGGLGLHTERGALFADIDVSVTNFTEGTFERAPSSLLTALRVMVGWRFMEHLGLVGGPALNVMTSWSGEDLDLAITPQKALDSGSVTVRIYPGFMLGLQL